MKIFENKKSKNLKKNKSAFTLIELIVVITILAILGTIAFIGFSGYSAKARDSVRTTELSDIKKGLELYRVEASKYPTPDNKVEITDNSTTYIYQGNTGELVTSIIGGNSEFKDPKTDKYYTYIVNKNKNKFRLAGIYENYQASGNSLAVAAEDKTYLKFLGDDLAYYTNSTGTPIEQLDLSADDNKIDITGDISAYRAVTTGEEPAALPSKLNKSCLTRMQYLGDTGDGVYKINPNGTEFDVYCDMTTDGGGWTLFSGNEGGTPSNITAGALTGVTQSGKRYGDIGQTEVMGFIKRNSDNEIKWCVTTEIGAIAVTKSTSANTNFKVNENYTIKCSRNNNFVVNRGRIDNVVNIKNIFDFFYNKEGEDNYLFGLGRWYDYVNLRYATRFGTDIIVESENNFQVGLYVR